MSYFRAPTIALLLLATACAALADGGDYDAAPTFSSGGVSVIDEARISTNYVLVDTIGQFAVDASAGPNFAIEHGYWHPSVVVSNVGSPSFNSGGTSAVPRSSASFRLVDSMGQFVVSVSQRGSLLIEHGMWHSEGVTVKVLTPGEAKAIGNGAMVRLGDTDNPMVVTSGTAVFADSFYVEDPGRSGGIAAQYGSGGGPALAEGDQVYLTGVMGEIGAERIIQSVTPVVVGATDPLGPVFMIAPTVGGGRFNEWTPGVLQGVGLHNVGLLVKTYSGPVTYRDPQGAFFYVNNGDGINDGFQPGIRVICDGFAGGAKLIMPNDGEKVVVTGISSIVMVGGQPARAIRPRKQADIQPVSE